jgi:hypothetical protein
MAGTGLAWFLLPRTGKGECAYSLDGKTWTPLSGPFDIGYDWRTGTFTTPTPEPALLMGTSFAFSDKK